MSPTKSKPKVTDPRRPAAVRTAILVGLVAFGIYAAFFVRAILNS